MKISKHFTRAEVRCRCGCRFDTMDIETLMLADAVRDYVGKSITPNSGARCLAYNRAIGSSDESWHVKARAMDLPVENPRRVYDWLCETFPFQYGFGLYRAFVHVDSRPIPGRWVAL